MRTLSFPRPLTSLVLSLLLSALLTAPALAGGWATVAMDSLPDTFRAGETHKLGYTILQHGATPFTGATTLIQARSPEGITVRFPAKAEGPNGHYVAEVTFPSEGKWTWEIVPAPFAPQPLAPITVLPGAPSPNAGAPSAAIAAPTPARSASVPWPLRAALAAGAILAGAAFALQLRSARPTRRLRTHPQPAA